MKIQPIEKQRAKDYAKIRLIKFNELRKKYQLIFEKAKKTQDKNLLDKINNKINEEMAKFSHKYWRVKE